MEMNFLQDISYISKHSMYHIFQIIRSLECNLTEIFEDECHVENLLLYLQTARCVQILGTIFEDISASYALDNMVFK
jgi:hypothetical protein